MTREHLNMTGGQHWLPFLRAQVRKFKDVEFASQQYVFSDSVSGRFVKTGTDVYIYLEGGSTWLAWAQDVGIENSEATYRVMADGPPYDPPDEPEYAELLTNAPGQTRTTTWHGWAEVPNTGNIPSLVGLTPHYQVTLMNPIPGIWASDLVREVTYAQALAMVQTEVRTPPSGVPYTRQNTAKFCKQTRVTQSFVSGPTTTTDTYEVVFVGLLDFAQDVSYQTTQSSTSYYGWAFSEILDVEQFTPYLSPPASAFTPGSGVYAGTDIYDTVLQDAWVAAQAVIVAANLALYNAWMAAVAAYDLAWPDLVAAHFLSIRIPQRTRQQALVAEEVASGMAAKYLAEGIWFDYVPKKQRATPLFIQQTDYIEIDAYSGALVYEVTDYADPDNLVTRELVGTWASAAIPAAASPWSYGTTGSTLFTLNNVLPDVAARAGFGDDWTLPGKYLEGQLISGTREVFGSAVVQNFTYTSPVERAAWAKRADTVTGVDPLPPGSMLAKGVELIIVALEYETYDQQYTNSWKWLSSRLWTLDPILPTPPETSVPASLGSDVDPGPTPRTVRSVAIYKQKYDFVNVEDKSLGLEWKAATVVPLPQGAAHFSGSVAQVVREFSESGDATKWPFAVFILRGAKPGNLPADEVDEAVVTAKRMSSDIALKPLASAEWETVTTIAQLRDKLTLEALQLLKLIPQDAA